MAEQFNTHEGCTDLLNEDFSNPQFQAAFRQYFGELGIEVKDWGGLFQEMNRGNEGENNAAYVRTGPAGCVIGFILFIPIRFTSWFFEETRGFIREFWVAKEHRGQGHGSALLALAEAWFLRRELYTAILTTDTAEAFYRRHGYAAAPGCGAKNRDGVFVKSLK